MSSTLLSEPPYFKVRWLRPYISTAYLDLPANPIVPSGSTSSGAWQALSERESEECEKIWETLSDEDKIEAEKEEEDAANSGETADENTEDKVGVSVGKDRLFEVDVRHMRLVPIYWKLNGPPLRMKRATWMFDETRPVKRELQQQLDLAYLHIEPWKEAYQDELSTALALGPEAHEKLRYPLKSLDQNLSVIFEDENTARLVSENITSKMSSTLLSPFRKKDTKAPLPAGTRVYRGYDEAVRRRTPPKDPVPPPENPEPTAEKTKQRGPGRPETPETQVGEGADGTEEITDLILVIHGIGQGMAASYEAFNFLYATNQFRRVARKQATDPALASIMRNRRVQFLPVQWRTNLQLSLDEENERRERENEGLDNRFTLGDITLNNKIPFVREVMNNVLIDVPYFMRHATRFIHHHHRQRMIESVRNLLNRTYRMWCARNPGFEFTGRVHIIAHSLGSALSAHILSKQPTRRPPLSKIKCPNEITEQFLFNTRKVWFDLMLHTERTLDSPSDEALDRVGVFGCLAVDTLYNVFNTSDPIAAAQTMLPSAIPAINASMFGNLSNRVSRMFDVMPKMGFSSSTSPPTSSSARSNSSSRPRPAISRSGPTNGSGFELGGANERLEGTRAERRFWALNPHGTLDFFLPSEGNISEYVDMLTAHSSYWGDPNLAAFVLSEIFARKEDLMRTGLGPARGSSKTRAGI
ncbi:hypothetical protein SISNIDRAFT_475303 [Sistotremastrum niveocremeum HHB9708]|uniref:DDHD domain-containing protein n=1 Tax=Sistotremastrum niveocremeum HHB9708 TaxID=1314777 RepID=A0A164RC44_9AGAM|nr:hypothetical protein SISNIDRAFT_475303 [Sistotremastrum niveocremeum HHB9708]